MSVPCRNVELKAIDRAPENSREVCTRLGAANRGTLLQRDTYFNVLSGGLKLRQESPGAPHLIQFEREDLPEARPSNYRIVEVADGDTCLAALSAALGVGVVVEKKRQLFLWRGVRIHLDEVVGLGRFIELEAVAPPESDLEREHALVAELRSAFAITDDRLRPHGYAHLLAGGPRAAAIVGTASARA